MVQLLLAELLEVTSTSGRQADASQRTRAALAIASFRLAFLRQLYLPEIQSLPPAATPATTTRSSDAASDAASFRPLADAQELTLLARFSARTQAQAQPNAQASASGSASTASASAQSNAGSSAQIQQRPDVLECIARLSLCSSTSFTFGFMRRAWRTRDADDLELVREMLAGMLTAFRAFPPASIFHELHSASSTTGASLEWCTPASPSPRSMMMPAFSIATAGNKLVPDSWQLAFVFDLFEFLFKTLHRCGRFKV